MEKLHRSEGAGLIIGRFQPFHLGHLLTVQGIIRECGYAKVAIGSAQYSQTQKNPFTSEERERMIHAALAGVVPGSSYRIYRVPDIHDAPRWVGHVEGIVGKFSRLYTLNPVNERLFREAGHQVVQHEKVEGMSASRIRGLIAKGEDAWQGLVPEAVASIIDEIEGAARIRSL